MEEGIKGGEKEKNTENLRKKRREKEERKKEERKKRGEREKGENTCVNLKAKKETSDFGLGIKLEVESW